MKTTSQTSFSEKWNQTVGGRRSHTLAYEAQQMFLLLCWWTNKMSYVSLSRCQCLYCIHLLSDPHTSELWGNIPLAQFLVQLVLLCLCFKVYPFSAVHYGTNTNAFPHCSLATVHVVMLQLKCDQGRSTLIISTIWSRGHSGPSSIK